MLELDILMGSWAQKHLHLLDDTGTSYVCYPIRLCCARVSTVADISMDISNIFSRDRFKGIRRLADHGNPYLIEDAPWSITR